MLQTISIIVYGKVQGVFYRQSTKETATALSITGTVRNLPDNTVEIIATGEEEQLSQLYNWCKKGTPGAIVTRIEKQDLPLQAFNRFSVIRF